MNVDNDVITNIVKNLLTLAMNNSEIFTENPTISFATKPLPKTGSKPHQALRGALRSAGIEYCDIEKRWHRCTTYISERFTGKKSFTVVEAYDLIAMAGLEPRNFYLYFPPDFVKKTNK